MNPDSDLNGWIPLYLRNGQVHWAYMGEERFTAPFCQENLQQLATRPFNQLFGQSTGLEVLAERAKTHPGLPLKGLVFHMSRCGSTLTAQALTALPDSVVLSEPPSMDTLLQWLIASPDFDYNAGNGLLQGLISSLGQARRASDQRLFIKTDCWHICHIDRLLNAFPDVPWVFLYRNPLEVLVSQSRLPAMYLIPGFLVQHGLTAPEAVLTYPLQHGAWVLSEILTTAARAIQQHPRGMLINYTEMPHAITSRINGHFQLNLSADDIADLEITTARDAKNPQRPFEPDSAEKRQNANPELLEIAAQWLDEPYADLEQLRKQLG